MLCPLALPTAWLRLPKPKEGFKAVLFGAFFADAINAPFKLNNFYKIKIAMKKILFLIPFLPLFLAAQKRPDQQPYQVAPNDSNWEFYSQKGGSPLMRTGLDTLGKQFRPATFAPFYPTPTGNTQKNGFVTTPGDSTYYINRFGSAFLIATPSTPDADFYETGTTHPPYLPDSSIYSTGKVAIKDDYFYPGASLTVNPGGDTPAVPTNIMSVNPTEAFVTAGQVGSQFRFVQQISRGREAYLLAGSGSNLSIGHKGFEVDARDSVGLGGGPDIAISIGAGANDVTLPAYPDSRDDGIGGNYLYTGTNGELRSSPAYNLAPVEPRNQIVYGTGSGIDSDTFFVARKAQRDVLIKLKDSSLVSTADKHPLKINVGGNERVWAGYQTTNSGTTNLGAGILGVSTTDGRTMEMTAYQYGNTIRTKGVNSTLLELFLGDNIPANAGYYPTLSVRGFTQDSGAQIQARDKLDVHGVGVDYGLPNNPKFKTWSTPGYPAGKLTIENDRDNGTIAFATRFGTAPGDAVAERAIMLPNGTWGIGTTTPNNNWIMDVASSMRVRETSIVGGELSSLATSYSNIVARNATSKAAQFFGHWNGSFNTGLWGSIYDANTGIFHIGDASSGGPDALQSINMVRQGSGNVWFGVGLSNPVSKMHINGQLTISGDIWPTGAFHDSANSPGTSGQFLSSSVTGTAWANDNNGIYGGSGTVPNGAIATMTNDLTFSGADATTTQDPPFRIVVSGVNPGAQTWKSTDTGDSCMLYFNEGQTFLRCESGLNIQSTGAVSLLSDESVVSNAPVTIISAIEAKTYINTDSNIAVGVETEEITVAGSVGTVTIELDYSPTAVPSGHTRTVKIRNISGFNVDVSRGAQTWEWMTTSGTTSTADRTLTPGQYGEVTWDNTYSPARQIFKAY